MADITLIDVDAEDWEVYESDKDAEIKRLRERIKILEHGWRIVKKYKWFGKLVLQQKFECIDCFDVLGHGRFYYKQEYWRTIAQ